MLIISMLNIIFLSSVVSEWFSVQFHGHQTVSVNMAAIVNLNASEWVNNRSRPETIDKCDISAESKRERDDDVDTQNILSDGMSYGFYVNFSSEQQSLVNEVCKKFTKFTYTRNGRHSTQYNNIIICPPGTDSDIFSRFVMCYKCCVCVFLLSSCLSSFKKIFFFADRSWKNVAVLIRKW